MECVWSGGGVVCGVWNVCGVECVGAVECGGGVVWSVCV